LRDVEGFVIEGEEKAVGPRGVEGYPMDAVGSVGFGVETVDGIVIEFFMGTVGAPGTGGIFVEGVGEPDVALGIDDDVVGDVETLALK